MLDKINKAKQEIAKAILEEIENEYDKWLNLSNDLNDFYNKITNTIRTKYLFKSDYIDKDKCKLCWSRTGSTCPTCWYNDEAWKTIDAIRADNRKLIYNN